MTNALPMIVPRAIRNPRTGKPSGQKAPLQPKEVWAIRVRLQLAGRIRDLALFNLAIDSKLKRLALGLSKAKTGVHQGLNWVKALNRFAIGCE